MTFRRLVFERLAERCLLNADYRTICVINDGGVNRDDCDLLYLDEIRVSGGITMESQRTQDDAVLAWTRDEGKVESSLADTWQGDNEGEPGLRFELDFSQYGTPKVRESDFGELTPFVERQTPQSILIAWEIKNADGHVLARKQEQLAIEDGEFLMWSESYKREFLVPALPLVGQFDIAIRISYVNGQLEAVSFNGHPSKRKVAAETFEFTYYSLFDEPLKRSDGLHFSEQYISKGTLFGHGAKTEEQALELISTRIYGLGWQYDHRAANDNWSVVKQNLYGGTPVPAACQHYVSTWIHLAKQIGIRAGYLPLNAKGEQLIFEKGLVSSDGKTGNARNVDTDELDRWIFTGHVVGVFENKAYDVTFGRVNADAKADVEARTIPGFLGQFAFWKDTTKPGLQVRQLFSVPESRILGTATYRESLTGDAEGEALAPSSVFTLHSFRVSDAPIARLHIELYTDQPSDYLMEVSFVSQTRRVALVDTPIAATAKRYVLARSERSFRLDYSLEGISLDANEDTYFRISFSKQDSPEDILFQDLQLSVLQIADINRVTDAPKLTATYGRDIFSNSSVGIIRLSSAQSDWGGQLATISLYSGIDLLWAESELEVSDNTTVPITDVRDFAMDRPVTHAQIDFFTNESEFIRSQLVDAADLGADYIHPTTSLPLGIALERLPDASVVVQAVLNRTAGEKGYAVFVDKRSRQYVYPLVELASDAYLVEQQRIAADSSAALELVEIRMADVARRTSRRFQPVTEVQLESELHDVKPNGPWNNRSSSLDVNNDGLVSAIDVLLVINTLNRGNTNSEGESVSFVNREVFGFFPDTNDDYFVSPIDALLIINYLNASSFPNGEGEFFHTQECHQDESELVRDNRLHAAQHPPLFLASKVLALGNEDDIRRRLLAELHIVLRQ